MYLGVKYLFIHDFKHSHFGIISDSDASTVKRMQKYKIHD